MNRIYFFILFCACSWPDDGYSAKKLKYFRLENAAYRIVVGMADSLYLISLKDKRHDSELITEYAPVHPLLSIVAKERASRYEGIASIVQEQAELLRFQIRFLEGSADVSIHLLDDEIEFDFLCRGKILEQIERIEYPVISGIQGLHGFGGDDTLVLPRNHEGVLIANPYFEDPVSAVLARLPYDGVQMVALYDKLHGFILSTNDHAGSLKTFLYDNGIDGGIKTVDPTDLNGEVADRNRVSICRNDLVDLQRLLGIDLDDLEDVSMKKRPFRLSLAHHLPSTVGAVFEPSYTTKLSGFEGNWQNAANRYAKWAVDRFAVDLDQMRSKRSKVAKGRLSVEAARSDEKPWQWSKLEHLKVSSCFGDQKTSADLTRTIDAVRKIGYSRFFFEGIPADFREACFNNDPNRSPGELVNLVDKAVRFLHSERRKAEKTGKEVFFVGDGMIEPFIPYFDTFFVTDPAKSSLAAEFQSNIVKVVPLFGWIYRKTISMIARPIRTLSDFGRAIEDGLLPRIDIDDEIHKSKPFEKAIQAILHFLFQEPLHTVYTEGELVGTSSYEVLSSTGKSSAVTGKSVDRDIYMVGLRHGQATWLIFVNSSAQTHTVGGSFVIERKRSGKIELFEKPDRNKILDSENRRLKFSIKRRSMVVLVFHDR